MSDNPYLIRIDDYIGHLFSKLLGVLCGATGKTNVFFARLALCGVIISATANVVLRDSGALDYFNLGTTLLLITPFMTYVLHLLEQDLDSSGEFLPFSSSIIGILRPFVTLVGIVQLATSGLQWVLFRSEQEGYWALFGFFMAAMVYFASDPRPRSKSVFRRAFEWLGDHMPSVSLAPHPALVPVKV